MAQDRWLMIGTGVMGVPWAVEYSGIPGFWGFEF